MSKELKHISKADLKTITESLYKLEKKIANAIVTLKLETETHVPDLMTRIRILPSVAVVGQTEKVERYMDGDALLTMSIKYLPRTSEIYGSLRALCRMMKKLPGVKAVTVDMYNKKKITLRGQKIIF
tara:strand:- start:56 stop:436 length:381 start_codon:yes stop_codon:yes gene_type:complete